jgi:hypothetical protein
MNCVQFPVRHEELGWRPNHEMLWRTHKYYFAHSDGNQSENAGIGTPQEG